MTNSELKKFAKQNGIFQYQIAEYLGMAESKLSAMYRKPADEEMQRAIVNAVNELKKGMMHSCCLYRHRKKLK